LLICWCRKSSIQYKLRQQTIEVVLTIHMEVCEKPVGTIASQIAKCILQQHFKLWNTLIDIKDKCSCRSAEINAYHSKRGPWDATPKRCIFNLSFTSTSSSGYFSTRNFLLVQIRWLVDFACPSLSLIKWGTLKVFSN